MRLREILQSRNLRRLAEGNKALLIAVSRPRQSQGEAFGENRGVRE